MLVLSEWVAQYAAALLWEVPFTWPLWLVAPRVWSFMRTFYPALMVGSQWNQSELHSLLADIALVDCSLVPAEHARR